MKKQRYVWIIIGSGAVLGILVYIVVSLLVRTYVVQAFEMPSGSMKPTLLVGDYFLTDKKYARTKTVKRGDVLIFEYPNDRRIIYIKRVVGLPGESIEIRNKRLYIDHQSLDESYVMHTDERVIGAKWNQRDNFGPITIPDNSYFMMGDNRDQSNDSRFWGFLHASKIKGKADVIYWSWDKTHSRVRWDRIGKSIH